MVKTIRIPDKYFEEIRERDRDTMGATFRAWKAFIKDIEHSKLLTFDGGLEEVLLANPKVKNYKRHTPYHATFNYWNLHVSYYPTKGKWVVNNERAINGGFISMINYLDKRAELITR